MSRSSGVPPRFRWCVVESKSDPRRPPPTLAGAPSQQAYQTSWIARALPLVGIAWLIASGCDQLAGSARSGGDSGESTAPAARENAEPQGAAVGTPSKATEPTELDRRAAQLALSAAATDDWRKMVREQGGDHQRVAVIKLLDLERLDAAALLRERTQWLASQHAGLAWSLHLEPDRAAVLLAPAKDPEKLANELDVGRVVRFDPQLRIVQVVANPRIFPRNESGKAEDPTHPEYFQVNYGLLQQSRTRRDAAERLAAADSSRCRDTELCARIAQEFERLIQDQPGALAPSIALAGVVNWGGRGSTPMLIQLLEESATRAAHPYHENLGSIIAALGQLADPQGVPPLVALLQRPSDQGEIPYRGQLVAALVSIGPAAETAVLAVAPSQDPQICMAAIEVLGQIGTSKSLETLRRAARARNLEVRAAALAATESIKQRLREQSN